MTPVEGSMSAPETLLPCPFCGGEAEKLGGTTTVIRCANDQCISRHDFGGFNNFNHEADAIAAWNTRPATASNAAMVGELVEALFEVLDTQGAISDLSEFPNCLNMTEDRGREILALIARAKASEVQP